MKILNILIKENAMEMYRDLTGIQSVVLHRVVTGKTTYETASPRERETMEQLVDLGLLDSYYEPTKLGRGVVYLSQNKQGSYEAREIQRRMQAMGREPFNGTRRYTDHGDNDDLDADDVPSASIGARAIDSGAIVR